LALSVTRNKYRSLDKGVDNVRGDDGGGGCFALVSWLAAGAEIGTSESIAAFASGNRRMIDLASGFGANAATCCSTWRLLWCCAAAMSASALSDVRCGRKMVTGASVNAPSRNRSRMIGNIRAARAASFAPADGRGRAGHGTVGPTRPGPSWLPRASPEASI